MTKLYSTILPYQTRILYLPKRHAVGLDDTIECYLYVADILHPVFGGFGLRTGDGKGDRMIQYNALSYTWGSAERTANIVCNGMNISITKNLRDALAAIRIHGFGSEYLWVDQICINQSDDQEKAEQVQHMIRIYEMATNTIARLGDPSSRLAEVIAAMTWDLPDNAEGKKQSEDISNPELVRAISGARWIYSAPWFKRLWVHARNLRKPIATLPLWLIRISRIPCPVITWVGFQTTGRTNN